MSTSSAEEMKSKLFRLPSKNGYSGSEDLPYLMNIACSAGFHSKSGTRQSPCTDKKLSAAVDGFDDMQTTIAIVTQNIGQIWAYVDYQEMKGTETSMGYLINMLGALSPNFRQIGGMLEEAH